MHSHAHTIPTAKVQRIFEIYKYSEKISQNYSTAYGLLSTSGPIIRFIGEVMERRNFSNNQICNFFIRGPQRAMLEWGEQRPWSPADLIGAPRELRSNGERRSDGALYFGMPKSFSEVRDDEGYRLCDSSAECEQALLSLKKRNKIERCSLLSLRQKGYLRRKWMT